MSLQHIFVTGGTGFIGSRVCERLLGEGLEVTVFTRNVATARRILPAAINLVDQLDTLAPVHGIINLAGAPLADRRWNERRKQMFYNSRVGLTEALFRHFSENSRSAPRVLINGSAIGYYGPRGDEIITESSLPGSGFASDLCRSWEAAARRFEELGTRVCRLRTGIVLGPDGGALKSMLPAFRLGLGGPIGNGRQWMSWIHLDDMVEVIFLALTDDGLRGAVNATAPNPVTNKEFSQALGKVLARPALLTLPAFVARALFGEMAEELLLAGQKVIPKKLVDNRFQFNYTELESALRSILNRH